MALIHLHAPVLKVPLVCSSVVCRATRVELTQYATLRIRKPLQVAITSAVVPIQHSQTRSVRTSAVSYGGPCIKSLHIIEG